MRIQPAELWLAKSLPKQTPFIAAAAAALFTAFDMKHKDRREKVKIYFLLLNKCRNHPLICVNNPQHKTGVLTAVHLIPPFSVMLPA